MQSVIFGKQSTGKSTAVLVDSSGRVVTTATAAPATATATNVTAAATSTLLKAANASRKGLTIYNNSDKVLHISLVSPATADSACADLAAESGGILGGYYELPYGYAGAIYGIWEAAPTGKANLTELT